MREGEGGEGKGGGRVREEGRGGWRRGRRGGERRI